METIETIVPFSVTPPRFLADANYNESTVRGLRRRRPDLYITTAHYEKIDDVPDPIACLHTLPNMISSC